MLVGPHRLHGEEVDLLTDLGGIHPGREVRGRGREDVAAVERRRDRVEHQGVTDDQRVEELPQRRLQEAVVQRADGQRRLYRLEPKGLSELEAWLGTVAGKFVAISFPQPTCRPLVTGRPVTKAAVRKEFL